MKKDDEERFWNLAVYKVYMTNKERDEMLSSPAFWVILGLVTIGIIIFAWLTI